ncbi:MAG: NfeD family protein [Saprospiraceae bacterium]
MQLLKIEQLWFNWSTSAIFWTIAIIATFLLVLLLVYSLFSDEIEPAVAPPKIKLLRLDARTVLIFFTVFGWTAAITSYFPNSFTQILLYGIIAGTGVTILFSLAANFAKKSVIAYKANTDTGRVLKPIPPHRGGIGKVYMSTSRIPIELDAITIGRELPVGMPVRIVDMLDEHTAIVEPLDNQPGGRINERIKE